MRCDATGCGQCFHSTLGIVRWEEVVYTPIGMGGVPSKVGCVPIARGKWSFNVPMILICNVRNTHTHTLHLHQLAVLCYNRNRNHNHNHNHNRNRATATAQPQPQPRNRNRNCNRNCNNCNRNRKHIVLQLTIIVQ